VLVYRLTASPLLSALTFALGLLPYVVGGTLLSAVADRFPSRRVLVCCDLVSAACAAAMLPAATPVGGLLALRAVMAAVSPVFTGTRMAALAEVLGDAGDRFVLGRSVIRLTAQSAQLLGFGAGGLLLAVVSPRAALGVTAAGFLGSALILRFGTRRRPANGSPGGARDARDARGAVTDSLASAARLLGQRRIRVLLLLAWVPPMFVCVPESLLTAYAGARGIGSSGLGLLMCGMPFGAVTSEFLAGSRLGPRGRERLVAPVAIGCTLPALGYALSPSPDWALLLQVLTGCGISYTLGLDRWFVAAVPPGLRGRAMTLLVAGVMTFQGLGMAVAGGIAEWAPVPAVMAGGGAVGAACSTAVLWRVHAERRQRAATTRTAGTAGAAGTAGTAGTPAVEEEEQRR